MKQTTFSVSINNNIISNKDVVRFKKRPKEIRLLADDEEVLDEADDIIGDELAKLNYPSRFCYTPKEIAKFFGMETSDLNSFLKDQGIISWNKGRWYISKEFMKMGLAIDRYKCVHADDGRRRLISFLVWTEKGRQLIIDIVLGHIKLQKLLMKNGYGNE